MPRNAEREIRFPIKRVAVAAIALWAIWAFAIPYLSMRTSPPWPIEALSRANLEAAGQFGDLFGGVNAFFSAFAFVFLGWTAWMQSQELKEQRLALREQRQEIAEEQHLTRVQLLESRFFAQIDSFRTLALGFKEAKGRINPPDDPIKQTCSLAAEIIAVASKAAGSDEDFKSLLAAEYDRQYVGEHRRAIEPYLHTLYYVIRSIHEAKDVNIGKKGYVDIVRGLLDSDELSLVALIAVVTTSKEFGVVDYVSEYTLLKHLPRGAARDRLEMCLPAAAFRRPRPPAEQEPHPSH